MPLRSKKKPRLEKQKQAQQPQPESKKPPAKKPKTTSSSSRQATTSKPSAAALIQQAIQEYGDNTTRMFEEILKILGMDPNLEEAEEETSEMRQTLQAILAAVEDLQVQERERFKRLENIFQQHLDISRGAAAAMQTVADALKASE